MQVATLLEEGQSVPKSVRYHAWRRRRKGGLMPLEGRCAHLPGHRPQPQKDRVGDMRHYQADGRLPVHDQPAGSLELGHRTLQLLDTEQARHQIHSAVPVDDAVVLECDLLPEKGERGRRKAPCWEPGEHGGSG